MFKTKSALIVLDNFLRLEKLRVKDCFSPRIMVKHLPHNSLCKNLKNEIISENYNYYPVYKETLDNITGYTNITDLIKGLLDKSPRRKLLDIQKTVLFVPENNNLLELLAEMNRKNIRLAVVIDEYGGSKGIIIFKHILYKIFGVAKIKEIINKYRIRPLNRGRAFELNPGINLHDFNYLFNTNVTSDTHYSLAGKIMEVCHSLPKIGSTIKLNNLSVEIVNYQQKIINRVIVHLNI
jgi:putative hemolysin